MKQLEINQFYFPNLGPSSTRTLKVLAGDVGGTKTLLALFEASQGRLRLVAQAHYPSQEFHSLGEVIRKFFLEFPNHAVAQACFGVAGPVLNGKVEITNLHWKVDARFLEKESGISQIDLINDLEATAYGLPFLDESQRLMIHQGGVDYPGNIAIVAPGTGLGEAGLFCKDGIYHPFATEGGHTDYSPRTEFDFGLYHYLQKKYGKVSWERVVAGPAIHDMYLFGLQSKNLGTPSWLQERISTGDPSAVISQMAMEEMDAMCMETMVHYVRNLAREASNLVLKLKATGGLYIAGGIPPKISPWLQQNLFYDNFLDCDRMQDLVEKVPVCLVLDPQTALWGAAGWAAFGMKISN